MVIVVRVPGLSDDDALTLARRVQPDVALPRLERVVRLAGGNPLLIEELAAGGPAPSSLERAILRQIDDVSVDERDVLELLAIADRRLPSREIGGPWTRLADLDLVREAADGLTLRHSLVAEAIAAMVPDERRVAVHVRLAATVRGAR